MTWRWRGRRGWCGPSRRADGPAGRRVGRPQGLAVDRDRPLPTGRWSGMAPVPLGQPRADRSGQGVGVQAGKGPADGGLGGDGEVAGASRRAPSAARTGWGASAAHSAIAAIDRAPARTAAAAMARIATSGAGGRRPAWGRGSWPGRRADAVSRLVGADQRGPGRSGLAGSGMMGRQARASTVVMRRWEPHDPGSPCLLTLSGHYRPTAHRDKPEPPLVLPCISSWFAASAREPTSTQR